MLGVVDKHIARAQEPWEAVLGCEGVLEEGLRRKLGLVQIAASKGPAR